jgi:nucleolar protein 4
LVDWAINKNDFVDQASAAVAEGQMTGTDEDPTTTDAPTKRNRLFKDCTIFARNISFETDDDDLFQYFSAFGSLRYAKIVY